MDNEIKWIVQAKNEENEIRDIDFAFVLKIHTIFAIGIHGQLKEEIDTLYNERIEDALVAYRNSPLYNHPSFRSFVATDEKMIIKVAALYSMYELKQEGRSFLLKMVNKGYKRIVDYVRRNPIINMDHLSSFLKERSSDYLPDMHLFIQTGVAMYIAGANCISPKESFAIEIVKELCGNVSKYINTDNVFESERSKNELSALRKFQELTQVKFARSENMDALIARIEEHHSKEAKNKVRAKITNDTFQWVYRQTFVRYQKPLSSIMRIYGLNDFNFYSKTKITREEYTDIYTLFLDSIQKERVKEEDFEVILVASFLLVVLVKQYKELRNAYIEEEGESIFKIVDELNRLKNRNEQLKTAEQVHKTKSSELESKVKDQEEYIKNLERQLREKEHAITSDESLRKEVIALREHVFSEENEFTIADDTVEKPNIEHLKVAIVGGHPRWHAKIKAEYPHIRTILPDEKTIDFSFLSNMDIVCFETSYSNHVLYKKAISALNNTDVSFQYINGSISPEDLAHRLQQVKR